MYWWWPKPKSFYKYKIFCKYKFYKFDLLYTMANRFHNKLDSNIKNGDSYSIISKKLLLKIRHVGNSIYSIDDPLGERLINRLCLSFSHLQEHKFRHDFGDAVNPLCTCTLETENIEYFFQHCQNITTHFTPMNDLNNISNVINSLNLTNFIRVILYGDKHFDNATNFKITTANYQLY